MIATLDAAARLAGGTLEVKLNYQGGVRIWTRARSLRRRRYERLFGEPPIVTAVHAGLETAVIGGKVPGLDMLSFGPQIEFPHSPDERVSVPTVERFWQLLVAVVDELSDPEKGLGREARTARLGSSARWSACSLVLGVTAPDRRTVTRAASPSPPASGRRACAAPVGVWRGELEAIVDDIRTPSAASTAGEEPQSETPQGRTGFVRAEFERAVRGGRDARRRHRQRRRPRHRRVRRRLRRCLDRPTRRSTSSRSAGLARRGGGRL